MTCPKCLNKAEAVDLDFRPVLVNDAVLEYVIQPCDCRLTREEYEKWSGLGTR